MPLKETNAGFSIRVDESGDVVRNVSDVYEDDNTPTGDPREQARRLLSGAAGGGPTGGATDGVDPSAGSIPGTPDSIIPSNFGAGSSGGNMPRNEASDPTRRNVTTTDMQQGIGVGMLLAVVLAIVLAVEGLTG